MSVTENGSAAVSAALEALHQLLPEHRWAVADSALLQSISTGQPVQRGVAGTRLKMLMRRFAGVGLAYPLLFLVGAVELAKLLVRQRHESRSGQDTASGISRNDAWSCYFVGFGAGAEESLFAHYCLEKGPSVARLDQTKVESMGRSHKVGVTGALAMLVRSLVSARVAIRSIPGELIPWKHDFLTFVGMRLAQYSFASAWFSQLKLNVAAGVEVCFLAADTAAFAACNAGLTTRYLQHGLIRISLALPDFDLVDALTHDEAAYFRRRLPKAAIRLVRPPMSSLKPRRPPGVLVASGYADHYELGRISPLLQFIAERGIVIHVRPHPRGGRSFWEAGGLPFPVIIEDSDVSFDAALERLRPALVVSWFSTALADALYRGIIPVTVCALDDSNVRDMVYPLFRRSLHWPTDRAVLEEILADDASYQGAIERLSVGLQ